MKSLKVIFKDDTKRASKIPDSFGSLYQMIPSLFPGEELTKYTLKYKDSDDDFVTISSEQDFKLMLESCDGAIKIHVSTQDLEKSFVSLNESVQMIEKPALKEPAKEAEIIKEKSQEVKEVIAEPEVEVKDDKERALKRELYEQLDQLRDQKDQTSTKIREVRSKITEIKNIQQEDFRANPEIKQQRRQDRQELQKQNDELVKVKDALIKQIVKLQEKLRTMRKTRDTNKEEEIDFDSLNKDRVDEIVKEVLIDLLPVISRKVLNRIKQEFQPHKKSLVETRIEEEHKFCAPIKQKTTEHEINIPNILPPVVAEMKKEVPLNTRFNMSYDQPIIIPKEILPGDQKIWVTIEIKNTGTVRWPKGAKLYYVRGLDSSDKLYVPELYPADHQKITLMFENPKQAGQFESVWKLGCETASNGVEYVDKEIIVKFKVQEPKSKKGKGKVEVAAPPAPAKPEVSDKVLQEALKLQEAFPALSLDQLIKVIRESPNASMEEHVNALLQLPQ